MNRRGFFNSTFGILFSKFSSGKPKPKYLDRWVVCGKIRCKNEVTKEPACYYVTDVHENWDAKTSRFLYKKIFMLVHHSLYEVRFNKQFYKLPEIVILQNTDMESIRIKLNTKTQTFVEGWI